MDIQIQQKQKMSKFKGRNSNKNNRNKFIGVRQRPSGRWVAEIKDTTQKIRMWLGTFETAEAAACAYDEAACLLRGSNTRTNFVTHVSANSPLASRIKNLLKSKQGSEEKHILETSTTNTSFTTRSTSGVDCFQEEKVDDHSQLFDDAYKPDLGNCIHEFDLSASYESNVSWGLENSGAKISFAQEMWELPKNVMAEASNPEVEFSEFEHMKVERQISASLYAMNGVQEYMDSVHDPCDSIWNLPDLCSLFC